MNNKRVNNAPDHYRQRQQIIEHQFGTLKRQWHFDHTLTKGKEKVLGEVYMIFTSYNLKRSLSILGFKDLMSKIKALLHAYFWKNTSPYPKFASWGLFQFMFKILKPKTDNFDPFTLSWVH